MGPGRALPKLDSLREAFCQATRGILVHALAEAALQPSGERNAVFAELVANVIHCGQRLAPAIGVVFGQQVELAFAGFESGSVDAQQPDRQPWLCDSRGTGRGPAEDFGVELRGVIEEWARVMVEKSE